MYRILIREGEGCYKAITASTLLMLTVKQDGKEICSLSFNDVARDGIHYICLTENAHQYIKEALLRGYLDLTSQYVSAEKDEDDE